MLTDHVALHVGFRRRRRRERQADASPLHSTGDVGSSATGLGACATTAGLVSSSPSSHTVPVSQVRCDHSDMVPVVLIGIEIMQCIKAMQDVLSPDPAQELSQREIAAITSQISWNEVPVHCGFKIVRPGGRDGQRNATLQDKYKQRESYGLFKHWAMQACHLSVAELREVLSKASQAPHLQRGKLGLPRALQSYQRQSEWLSKGVIVKRGPNHTGHQVTAREHAALHCQLAGLEKAACHGVVKSMGGPAEMERLLNLSCKQLEHERCNVHWTLRNAGSCGLKEPCVHNVDMDRRVATVIGLFQVWLFAQGARQCGGSELWDDLLQRSSLADEQDPPARIFALDGEVFSVTKLVGECSDESSMGRCIDSGKLLMRASCRVKAAWWILVWKQACAQVQVRFGNDRRRLTSSTSHTKKRRLSSKGNPHGMNDFIFSMEELFRKLFQWGDTHETEQQLAMLFGSLESFAKVKLGMHLRDECGRMNSKWYAVRSHEEEQTYKC